MLKLRGRHILSVCAATFFLAAPAWAGQVAVGFVSWDVNFPGNAGQFDITNLTGPNASPSSFPITSLLNLSSLSLVVNFVGGSSMTYGQSSFTLSSDGQSFDGTAIPIGGTNPLPISATLTGIFSTTSITDPGADTILPGFSVTFSDSPSLVDGDFGIIYATQSGTPEPQSFVLMALGLAVFGALVLKRRLPFTSGSSVGGHSHE